MGRVATLRIAFSRRDVTAADADAILVPGDGTTHELSRGAARDIADIITDALSARREFLRTVGQHRADGGYVVARRGADSSGNRKAFDSFAALTWLHERLPKTFDDDVDRTGINGSRRHMVVRHLAEQPAFECRTVSRNPLGVSRAGDSPTPTTRRR